MVGCASTNSPIGLAANIITATAATMAITITITWSARPTAVITESSENTMSMMAICTSTAEKLALATAPALEIVSIMGVGYDGVDVAAAKARGAMVTHTPDVLNDDVADLALALALSIARRLPQADGSVKPEPRMGMDNVVAAFMTMARLPPEANILNVTVMATAMPFVGRG